MSSAIRSLLAEPRVANPPAGMRRDWALVAIVLVASVLEATLREGLEWRPIAFVLCAGPALGLPWRRTHPLSVLLVAFGAQTAAELAAFVGPDESLSLHTTVYGLLLPYALFRWGAGRDAAVGLVLMSLGVLVSAIVSENSADALAAVPVVAFLAALGASMRYRVSSRLREADQVKLRERELLARELHDSVAHHVSAIAIQAQAGRVLAASQPAAAVDALAIIEEAASRALAEMRTLVGALRDAEEPDRAPQRGVADIERLAHGVGDGPRVEVELSGALDDLTPLVDAAVYRLAQESITNAVRHARHATLIDVRVAGDRESVHLTVRDDGEAGPSGATPGYGLVGMTERATLLGGTLKAGPGPGSGWTVDAVLPRNGTGS